MTNSFRSWFSKRSTDYIRAVLSDTNKNLRVYDRFERDIWQIIERKAGSKGVLNFIEDYFGSTYFTAEGFKFLMVCAACEHAACERLMT